MLFVIIFITIPCLLKILPEIDSPISLAAILEKESLLGEQVSMYWVWAIGRTKYEGNGRDAEDNFFPLWILAPNF